MLSKRASIPSKQNFFSSSASQNTSASM
ncbi:TPA: hypothetical protein N0F65_004924 [Lagenidium giganteum]|uniref:Uncharacterized protein n=1 Tax=Lagenidium giganteum TaxID=4803 RepID=A0AAV2YZB6_9STRA|nr:TPA: hypothetical protein N0F65_004924 [Lagenidium giganteum]